MRVLLLCNYGPDGQQSMLRFGALMRKALGPKGVAVTEVQPVGRAGRLVKMKRAGGWRKWAGYIDKYLLFPPALSREVDQLAKQGPGVVHVVDHSNAVYVPSDRAVPWVATCHDLLAVRGALGEDTDCPASWLGKRLQRRVVQGLERAAAVGCDSTSTLGDLERLVRPVGPQLQRVIPLALNHPYRRVERAEALARLEPVASVPWFEPFIVHVGSNQARKNKAGIVRILGRLRGSWQGNVVFCGPEVPGELRALAESLGLGARIHCLARPDEGRLEAAFSLAHALLFPSKCEGFGWPVLEAQACGCPVICSDRTSLPEVGGAGALVYAFDDEAGMAEAVLRLAEPGFRAETVRRGFANLERFNESRMADAYCRLYEDALSLNAPGQAIFAQEMPG